MPRPGTDLSREDFEKVRLMLECSRKRTRPRKHDVYDIFRAVLFIVGQQVSWRALPSGFPPWRSVHEYYSQWTWPASAGSPTLLERALLAIGLDDAILKLHVRMRLYAIEVSADGAVLWVAGADGSCLGRFSKAFGIDVHRTAGEQMAGKNQCLFCTHASASEADWEEFRAQMLTHHHIPIPEDAIKWN